MRRRVDRSEARGGQKPEDKRAEVRIRIDMSEETGGGGV